MGSTPRQQNTHPTRLVDTNPTTIRTFLLSAALLTIGQASAQFPFPTDNAAWVNTLYSVQPLPPPVVYTLLSTDYYCVNGEDTTINSVAYTKLDHCGGAYKGALREDAGRVFYVPGDSLQEFLLYDFTLTDGETAVDVYFEPAMGDEAWLADITVSNTTISSEFEGRKVLYLQDGGTWIEGIGASWGLFSEPYVNVSNYELRLECMSDADGVHFPSWNIGEDACAVISSTREAALPTSHSVFPNPTTDGLLRVQGVRAMDDIVITASDGRALRVPMVYNGTELVIDLGASASGLYLVHLNGIRGREVHKIMRQ